jgi:hypothetical protein
MLFLALFIIYFLRKYLDYGKIFENLRAGEWGYHTSSNWWLFGFFELELG